jgi:hypothetical protein
LDPGFLGPRFMGDCSSARGITGHLVPQQTLPTDSPLGANTDPTDTGDSDQDADPKDSPVKVITGQRQQLATDGAPAHGPRQEYSARQQARPQGKQADAATEARPAVAGAPSGQRPRPANWGSMTKAQWAQWRKNSQRRNKRGRRRHGDETPAKPPPSL